MSGMMGIGFQGSRLRRMPVWGENDRVTRVIRVATYAKPGRPLFVLPYQVGRMYGVSWFPYVITWGISLPLY